MQKTILYLVLLLILGGGVYYFVFSNKENVFGAKEAGFTVKDTSDIGRIYLVRTSGVHINLTRTDSGWVLNDKFRPRENTLSNLITTLYKQTAQYPVPENAHNNVVKNLAGNSVKVEVYNRKGAKIRTFYVGGEALNFKGSYMLMEGAAKAYVVYIPGFSGYLTPYYSTDIADWRDRTVFNLKPEEIKTVSVKYPLEPLNSFTIENQDKPMVTTEPGIAGSNPLNERRVNAYLKFFENVYSEGYINGLKGMDSVIGSMPKFSIIDVADKKGRQQHVEIYYMPLKKRSKNLDAPDAKYDPDRYYAVMNNFQDTILIQSNTFDKLFRKAYEFYEADKQENPSAVINESK